MTNRGVVQNLGEMSINMAAAKAGLIKRKIEYLTRINAPASLKQTIADITVAGTIGSELFTLTYGGKSPTSDVFAGKQITYTADSDTATDVAAALVARINADPDLNDVLTASNAAGVISQAIKRERENPITSLAGSATGSATITASPTITNYQAGAVIPFGYAVGRYAANGDNACAKITTATGLTILGVAGFMHWNENKTYPYDESVVQGWAESETVPILKKGEIWVPVAAAVTRDTEPHILDATGQFTADGAGSSTAVVGAKYMTAAAAGGLALVSINLV